MTTPQEQAQDLLQPMLDLFGGADGGVGFAKLRHDFLPDLLQKYNAGDPLAAEFILMTTRFSVLCKTLMENGK